MSRFDESTPLTAFWFRRDLRLYDNRGLHHALSSGLPVLPVFIFDTDILKELKNPRDPRVEFIHSMVQEIDQQLKRSGSSLKVAIGRPNEIWRRLFNEFPIKKLYFNQDYEPYALRRDNEVRKTAQEFGVEIHSFSDQTIFPPDHITKADGKPYTVFTPFKNTWMKRLAAEPEVLSEYVVEPFFERFAKIPQEPIPPLEMVGFYPSGLAFPSREIPLEKIRRYHLDRDFPAVDGTSKLGIHLRFGTISIRRLVRAALELNETWLNELIWREFFMMILYHFPHVVDHAFRAEFDSIRWRQAEEDLAHWKEGLTGYPLVDAGMRQLAQTGFMHNRLRMVTASFLVKHLLIDWRLGERWFAEKLLDYELASNNGNWQWAAGTGCDAVPYFRIFNPELQRQRFDPKDDFIRQWVPEFGTPSYPAPIVDHDFARRRAIQVFAEAGKTIKRTNESSP
ncbi:MAG: DNA photolyase family protein [candidate division KSB1 bacterium]|nr:DNA photolyase family protein [candidate division KSB1 bacterium]